MKKYLKFLIYLTKVNYKTVYFNLKYLHLLPFCVVYGISFCAYVCGCSLVLPVHIMPGSKCL